MGNQAALTVEPVPGVRLVNLIQSKRFVSSTWLRLIVVAARQAHGKMNAATRAGFRELGGVGNAHFEVA